MSWTNIIIVSIVALTAAANLFLAVYVYQKNPKERVNKTFLYFGLTIFVWCLSNFFSMIIRNLFWIRATYAVGSMGAIAGIFLTSAISDRKISKWIKIFLFTIAAAIFTVVLFTPLILKDAVSFLNLDLVIGPFYAPWAVLMIFLISACIYIPFSSIRKVNEQRKRQILYFAIGSTIYAVWAALVSIILPFFGIAKFSDFDSPATIFLVGFTSYSIIKYHLMDISSLLFTAFIYSLVVVFIVASLLLLVFVSSYLFVHLLVWPIYVIIAVVSIVLFFIGRLFFVEKRDLEKAKISLTESLANSEENRIKAETERDKTATIISNFSDGLILLDDKDRIFSINYEAERILKLDPSRLLKKPYQSLSDFPKAEPVAAALSEGLGDISKKQVELAKDFIVELSVIPLNLDLKDIGHLIVLHDVSREKIVENMKTEFVSLAAHQLRTPLSIIKWSMSMLKGGDFGKLNKKQGKIITSAFRNNERLISLVNDLLNVTRIEEGRYLYKIAMTDMEEIVNSVIDSYKEEIKRRKIKIELKAPAVLPRTMLDAEKIKLVVQNLIDNTIKYSPEGSKIIITLKSAASNIEFAIQDFGIGIPQDQQGKIFTKFFRGDNAEKVNTVGSGLGLFLAQNIIEAHEGKIWFESEENKGTTFHFTLPVKKELEQ